MNRVAEKIIILDEIDDKTSQYVTCKDTVGVPMFWPDWQDQKMRQHQNRFGALGSSPPRPGEGSLQ